MPPKTGEPRLKTLVGPRPADGGGKQPRQVVINPPRKRPQADAAQDEDGQAPRPKRGRGQQEAGAVQAGGRELTAQQKRAEVDRRAEGDAQLLREKAAAIRRPRMFHENLYVIVYNRLDLDVDWTTLRPVKELPEVPAAPPVPSVAESSSSESHEDGSTDADARTSSEKDLRRQALIMEQLMSFVEWVSVTDGFKELWKEFRDLCERAGNMVKYENAAVKLPSRDSEADPNVVLGRLRARVETAEAELARLRNVDVAKEQQEQDQPGQQEQGQPGPGDDQGWKRPRKESMAVEALRLGFGTKLIPGHWSFAGPIGVGGQGHASVWVEWDDDGNVSDRKVVKESYFSPTDFENPAIWHGDKKNGNPLEAFLQRAVSLKDKSESCIVQLDTWVVYRDGDYKDNPLYRIYCEFCPHGDLQVSLDRHYWLMKGNKAHKKPMRYHFQTRTLWCIFERLTKAVCLMTHGHLPNDPKPKHEWVPIIHRDIKPDNIFLAAAHDPASQPWRKIPEPKLGDFGLAVPSALAEKQRNCRIGTEGWKAPEQEHYDTIEWRRHDWNIQSGASDIWSLGRTMLCLMSLEQWPRQFQFDAGKQAPQLSSEMEEIYPPQLRKLVHECLHVDPQKRIRVMKLCAEIDSALGKNSEEDGAGLDYDRKQVQTEMRYKDEDSYTKLARTA
ncbi:hypothetical protein LTR37_020392 [Vermiconidia calcicola]|uniref:Uncharacterized protein n=1 Tax=Vermiconidia calcicola TaxID=1690605 RepID=A0ACC3MBB7_9PEZI|nr:hypothetical protein LTR37_020392 [Vermiconidia calcicola]